MKLFLSKFGTTLLLVAPLFVSVSSQYFDGVCEDAAETEFTLLSNKVVGCDWLVEVDEKIDIRRGRWCAGVSFNDQVIYNKCLKSCNLCGCKDNEYFEAPFWETSDSEVTYKCAMLTDNPERTDFRRRKYCDPEKDTYVGEHCPFSCGFCPTLPPTAPPAPSPSNGDNGDSNDTTEPTSSPTASPIKGTAEPTKAPKTKAPVTPMGTKAPTVPKTKEPTVPKTKKPTVPKATKAPTVPKTKKPTVPKTKAPQKAKRTKAPTVPKTKAPHKAKTPKKCKKQKGSKKKKVSFGFSGDGTISLEDIQGALCPQDEEGLRRLDGEEEFEITSLDVKSLDKTMEECENNCAYTATANAFYTGKPTDADAFVEATTAFLIASAPTGISDVSVSPASLQASFASAEGADFTQKSSGANPLVIGPVMAVVGVAVIAVGFTLFRKVRSERASPDDSMSMGSAPSFRESLRPIGKAKYTNGQHLTGEATFPVSSNRANDEYEVDSLVQI